MTLTWTHDPAWLVIYALAAYRLTRLVTRDSLPPFPALRQTVLTRYGTRWWAPLIDCAWCLGFHVSWVIMLVASSPLATAWQWIAVPLALSAVVGLLSRRDDEEE